ncbi:hypothetical protein QR680_005046 [Steinernema hermaphroditum]|uniref:HTH OST-type domain-containing protein n=1 Tax=Steinernema hermaphroditum TaxID=289476 RepID=A0AA39HSZ2_9BILA|nr:hypothetical protein QR680_005046 [Steinernema hermaphroditum]
MAELSDEEYERLVKDFKDKLRGSLIHAGKDGVRVDRLVKEYKADWNEDFPTQRLTYRCHEDLLRDCDDTVMLVQVERKWHAVIVPDKSTSHVTALVNATDRKSKKKKPMNRRHGLRGGGFQHITYAPYARSYGPQTIHTRAPGLKTVHFGASGPHSVHFGASGPHSVHFGAPGPQAVHFRAPGPQAVHFNAPGPQAAQFCAPGPQTVHFNSPGPQTVHFRAPGSQTVHFHAPGPQAVHLRAPNPKTVHERGPEPQTAHVSTPHPKTVQVRKPGPKTEQVRTPDPKTEQVRTPDPKTEQVRTSDPQTMAIRKIVIEIYERSENGVFNFFDLIGGVNLPEDSHLFIQRLLQEYGDYFSFSFTPFAPLLFPSPNAPHLAN